MMHTSTGLLATKNPLSVKATELSASTTGDGAIPIILGLVYGFQYNKRSPGNCYESIELSLILIDEILALVSNFAEPQNWSNLALVGNDLIDVSASI